MARPLRIEFAGALYHLTSRGNERRDIFRSDRSKKWEQTAVYHLDTHPNVVSFAKNSGLGFAVPYVHNDQDHDDVPDFLVRVADAKGIETGTLILETKGERPPERSPVTLTP